MRKITVLFVAVLLSLTISIIGVGKGIRAYAIGQQADIDVLCAQYTETDTPNDVSINNYSQDFMYAIEHKRVDISSNFTTRTISSGEYFQNNCEFTGEK